MLKHSVTLALALGALTCLSSSAGAWGRHRGGCGDCGGCGGCGMVSAPCAPCGPVAAAPCAPAPTFVEQQVTTYRMQWVEKQVPCQVQRVVARTVNVPCTYFVTVPVTT